MDTPDPGVVKDSQPSDSQLALPNITPKSAGFGSPKATQDSWTAPRRSQVRQKAKASFLADDDDGGEDADEQDNNDVMADSRGQFENEMDLDSTASEPDSVPDRESEEGQDVFDDSPTPRASQAAHIPPQSAQPIPRSSRPDSSDPSSLFEALKKHPPAAVASKKPSRQKQTEKAESAAQGTTATQGGEEPLTKDVASRPKTASRKSLANSKVKLSALELEEETETGLPISHRTQGYDYSLPASNSNSPATSPSKKKAAPKKQTARKPVTKSNVREAKMSSTAPAKQTKAPSAGRVKQAKAASAPLFHPSPGAKQDEDQNGIGNMELEEEVSVLKPAPREEKTRGKVNDLPVKPGSPANEEVEDHIMISSDSTSSFPESDNTDDEDFECTRKMTPANPRRRTRAVAAQSQARKEAIAKVESNPAPASNSRGPEEDGSQKRHAGARSQAQPKKATKKAAAAQPHGVAAPSKPTSELAEEMRSSTEKPKGSNSTAERRTAANRITKDNGHFKQDHHVKQDTHVKQDPFVPSYVKPAERRETQEAVQASESVKPPKSTVRKPNIVVFGPDGPKNNGRSHKITASTDARSQGQQLGPSDAEHAGASQSRLAKGNQTAPKMCLQTTVEDGDSLEQNPESDQGRSGHTIHPSSRRDFPSYAPVFEADKNAVERRFDADTTEPTFEAEWADTTDTFVAGDAEGETLVENAVNSVAHFQSQQKQEATDDLDDNCGGEGLEQLAKHRKHPRLGQQRTVLGEVDTNCRSIPKDAPMSLPYLMKRKLPEVITVTEASPKQQSLTTKSGFQAGNFPTSRLSSAAFSLKDEGRPVKKPRYNSARAFQVDKDACYDRNPFSGSDSLPQMVGYETGDDIFGPSRKGKPFGPSAFVQRLISSESADRGPGQVGFEVPASPESVAVPRQSTTAFNHPTTARSVAPPVVPMPEGDQQMDDMGKRMRAALESKDQRAPVTLPSIDEHGKSFDMKGQWPQNASEQSRASEQDERARAWKKATEPYAESLGETMHKIVNTILRGLKANEAAIDDVVEDYRNDGQRVVERIAEKHRKERLLVVEQQEQERLRHLQAYGEARRVTETVLGKLESVDLDKIMLDVGKDSATNRLKQLKQRIKDA